MLRLVPICRHLPKAVFPMLAAGIAAAVFASPLAAQSSVHSASLRRISATRAELDRSARSIHVEDVRARVDFLASDALLGRATPSPGLSLAADSIAAAFRAAGLRPAGDSGSFVRRYRFQAHAVDPAARRLGFRAANGTGAEWEYGRDYFAYGALQAVDSAEAVFVGAAAMSLPPLPAAARGKVAVYTVPGTLIESVGVQDAALTSALTGGAAAVLLAADPVASADSMAWFAHQMEAAGVYGRWPIAGVRYPLARELFRAAGLDLDTLRARPAGEPVALPGVRITIRQPAEAHELQAPNVVAILPGSDPALRGQYVVVSAHFDHVGTGRPAARGDSIYNGADDNASGTVALVEAARALAGLPHPPARSIVFLAVSGEERGLKGSMAWVAHPTVPLDRVVADINLDMVARNAPDTLYAMGQAYTTLGPLALAVRDAHPELGFHALPADADPRLRWFSRSDQTAFIGAGIPVLFLTTMQHPDYHRVTDEPSRLDADKLTRVSRFLVYLAYAAANDPARPGWLAGGLAAARAAVR
jgi:hypothetical protein